MNTSDLLEQLLRAGQASLTQQGANAQAQNAGLGGLGGLLGGLLGGSGAGVGGLGGLLGGLLGGAGSLGAARGGASYTALASLGMLAFQAFQSWQQQQASAPQPAPRTLDQLDGSEAEAHSHAILCALIAAAKADGRIDEREQQAIYAEIARHADEPELQAWLDAEMRKPLVAADVARLASDPGMAAEMYLASVLLVDSQQEAERTYLDELAYQLKLDPTLQAHLEQQAKGGQAG